MFKSKLYQAKVDKFLYTNDYKSLSSFCLAEKYCRMN